MPGRRTSNHIPAEDLDAPPKQGIVTILGADCDKNTKAGSIRRTLSADMSSKKWLNQNGFFSPIKKIADQHHSDEDQDFKFNQAPNQDQVWRSIQAEKQKNEPPQTGVWGLILTQKSDNSLLQVQPPYIHPMVKRTKSGLSEKSLEVCTESLGSETGSDCFSCHSDEETQGSETEEMQRGEEVDPFADLHVVKYKNSPARPFPPPLPSIAGGDSGAPLHVHSHRENGRLVLEAVSVAPRKYFHARRHEGRLLLTLEHAPANLESEAEKSNDKEEAFVEENLTLPTGMISAHKSGLVMKKLMAVGNINPKWANEAATRDGGEVPQALPPRPPVGRLAPPFNTYEYFWRSKPGFMIPNKNSKMNQDLVMYMRGCKEARRSLIWEPYCIATS